MTRIAPLAVLLPLANRLPAQAPADAAPAADAVARVVAHYAAIVHASYADTLAAAREMQASIGRFLADPSAATLAQARKSWLAAREWYGQTEGYRFYGGPIDDDDGPEGQINAWPMDEAYVDGIPDQPDVGIINDRSRPVTRELLVEANERGGEENVSTGWHAIEFLLWGQDLANDGPGARPYTDFVDGRRPNADRRRQYLAMVTGLLIDDLQSLVDAWAPGRKNYRADFESGGIESVRKIIVGLGSLSRGELAGERLEVAANTQDQEDEHSCFSDNTHRDVVANAVGIANAWQGSYRRRDGSTLRGASLESLVAAADPALANRTGKQIAASVAAAEAIEPPFDQEIIGDDEAPGRKRLRTLIDSLVQQSKDLVDSASAIGITRLTLQQP
jgi:putative iron-regulated protein